MMAQTLLPTLPCQTIGREPLPGRNVEFQCGCRSSHQDVAQSLPYIPRALETQGRLIMKDPGVPYKAWVLVRSSWTFNYCLQDPGSEPGPVLLQMSLNSHAKPPPEEPSCLHGKHLTNWATFPGSTLVFLMLSLKILCQLHSDSST